MRMADSRDIIKFSDRAPIPLDSYVMGRSSSDDLFWVTGQVGRNPQTGAFVEGGFSRQFHQAVDNLEGILNDAGLELGDVIYTWVQFIDPDDVDLMDDLYSARFPDPKPARTSYAVRGLWREAVVQIAAVAQRRED